MMQMLKNVRVRLIHIDCLCICNAETVCQQQRILYKNVWITYSAFFGKFTINFNVYFKSVYWTLYETVKLNEKTKQKRKVCTVNAHLSELFTRDDLSSLSNLK